MPKNTDVEIANGGSIFLVTPLTPAAREWVDANVPLETWQWFGPGFAVEHRYILGLIDGMKADGLEVA
jgi:hypothetical protein